MHFSYDFKGLQESLDLILKAYGEAIKAVMEYDADRSALHEHADILLQRCESEHSKLSEIERDRQQDEDERAQRILELEKQRVQCEATGSLFDETELRELKRDAVEGNVSLEAVRALKGEVRVTREEYDVLKAEAEELRGRVTNTQKKMSELYDTIQKTAIFGQEAVGFNYNILHDVVNPFGLTVQKLEEVKKWIR